MYAKPKLTDLAVGDILVGLICRFGEVVVQIAPEVEVQLRRLGHHLPPFVDIVRDRLLDEYVFPRFEGFHGRLEMPAAVLVAAGADIDDIELLVLNHL